MIHDCLCKMLEVKKRATEVSVSEENLYANEAYGMYWATTELTQTK